MRELHWYRLDEHRRVVPMDWKDREAFVALFQHTQSRVGLSFIDNACRVSTVFVPVDYSLGTDLPLVFETLVLGGPYDQQGERYSTWADAELGHRRWVEQCRLQAQADGYVAHLDDDLEGAGLA